MMLIDFHTHAFPEKLASRVMQSLSHSSGGLVPQTDGTLEGLRSQLRQEGVDRAVLLSIASNPKQQTNVNNFAIEANKQADFWAFGSVHPDAPDALEELERLKEAGIQGIKLHPEYQGFYADDPKMKPIYEKLSQLGLIVLFHAGMDIGFLPPYHATPKHILGALKWLDTPVVAAHWGGLSAYPEMVEQLCGIEGLYMDLSSCYGAIPRPVAQQILDKHGADRLLFASDMPWQRPSWQLRLLDTLEMTEEQREAICWKNAMQLLG